MERAVELADYVSFALFGALAVVASVQWIRQRNEATGWFAAMFLILSGVVIASFLQPEDPTGEALDWLLKIEIAVVVMFPYFLFRFMGSFVESPTWARWFAAGLTIGVIVSTLLLPSIPSEGDPQPTGFGIWFVAFLLQWSALSLVVTVRLWTAGRGQPSVAKARMRLLSLGALGLTTVVVVTSVASGDGESTPLSLLLSALTVLSVLAFFCGFAPPAWLRLIWRRREAEALQRGIAGLMASRTPEEVANKLLPHVVNIIGARGAALIENDGDVIATEGLSDDMMRQISKASPESLTTATETSRLLVLPFEFGGLIVWASPYTPFFGRDEVALVRSLGALTDVAMERAKLFRSVERARGELEEMNAALGKREAMLAAAEMISRIGSWESDRSTGETRWSDQMYRIHGVDPTDFELTRESARALVHPEDREHTQSVVEAAIERGDGFDVEYRIVRPSGDIRIVHAFGKIDADGDAPPRLVGVVQDVTERKESERALADAFSRERLARVGLERANTELESFVYTVSHDLNSPLISVLGYSDLLETDFGSDLPDEAKFYLGRIKASGAYMQSLIKDLLELSRVGRVQTDAAEVELGHLIEEITGEIRAGHPNVQVDLDGDLPAIHMNPLRARQLFANLFQNSVKYGGRPDVRIAVRAERDGNGSVTVSVADNGPGIAFEHRERVFGVFERLDNGQEGTGIGLAVCKRIVETAGGRIWIHDSDAGTDVRVSVPVAGAGDHDRGAE